MLTPKPVTLNHSTLKFQTQASEAKADGRVQDLVMTPEDVRGVGGRDEEEEARTAVPEHYEQTVTGEVEGGGAPNVLSSDNGDSSGGSPAPKRNWFGL